MTVTVSLICLAALLTPAATLEGVVLNMDGVRVADAGVFLEEELGAPLRHTQTGPAGTFSFEQVPPGLAGVIVLASGYALGGESVRVAEGDNLQTVTVRLRERGAVEGRVVGPGGRAVAGARITRVAITSGPRVGIPLESLGPYGVSTPVSDRDGRFRLADLPEGTVIAMKAAHPEYAQAAVADVTVGGEPATVEMAPGIPFLGRVLAGEDGPPVADASIVIRRAEPPYDTVEVRTDSTGAFAVHLRPGPYAFRAYAGAYQSPGWLSFTVAADSPGQRAALQVAPIARVSGEVRDAVSGQPIAGARVALNSRGRQAGVARTGHAGRYAFRTAEGENTVTLVSAPGYVLPAEPGFRMVLDEGAQRSLPTFWLAPVPAFNLHVVDPGGEPVAGAVVSVLWPPRFGWQTTDEAGRVDLSIPSIPPSGRVLGTVEHPSEPLGALFMLGREDAGEPLVEVQPLTEVRGRIVDARRRGVAGALAVAFCAGEGMPEAPLWRVLTREDGSFTWPAVFPHVPHRCSIAAGPGHALSSSFMARAGTTRDLGQIAVEDAESVASLAGKELDWRALPRQSGDLPELSAAGRAAVIMYCRADEARATVDALAVAREVFARLNVDVAAVVDGPFEGEASIPVLKGRSPASATTYVLDRQGRVVLETFGMPPLRVLQGL